MPVRTQTYLKDNFLEIDPYDYNIDLVDTFNLTRYRTIGTVYFVDPVNGSDTANSGQSSDDAFATMQHAIDQCTDDAGDVIVRMPGTEQITEAITFDKDGIVVVAANYGAAPVEGSEEGFSTYAAATYTDGPAAIISNPCAIIGLEFASRNTSDAAANTAAGSSAAIVIDDGVNFTYIKDCRFPRWWANVAGVKVIGNSYGVIEGCTFEGAFTAAIWYTSGPSHNPTYNKVIGNRFVSCAACVEYQAGTGSDANILAHNSAIDCTLFLDTNGETSSPDSVAYDNYLDFVAAANSFDVANIAALEVLGWKYIGNHYRET